ncbi:MAG: hypothetical protein K0041_09540 [Acidithiobacillus sp.]|nr:hypothetical protein [Acidithiobacillus sp.]
MNTAEVVKKGNTIIGTNPKTGNVVLINDSTGSGTASWNCPRYIRVAEVDAGTTFERSNGKNVRYLKEIGGYQYPRTDREQREYQELFDKAMRIAKARCGIPVDDVA